MISRRVVNPFFATVILTLLFSGCATKPEGATQRPSWVNETILEDDESDSYLVVGISRPFDNENNAVEDAAANATESFVRYCGVQVSSFDRSVEVYAETANESFSELDYEAQRSIRAQAFVRNITSRDRFIERTDQGIVAYVLLSVPKSEYDRIISEQEIRLSVDLMMYREDHNGNLIPFSQGDELLSGGAYTVFVRPSDVSYIYLFQIDAAGNTYRLFPNNNFKTPSNPIPAGVPTWIPNDETLFVLDETIGKEQLYLFASLKPIPELEVESPLSIANEDELDSVAELNLMGVGGVTARRSESTIERQGASGSIAEVTNKITSQGAFYYTTWFWHR